MTVQANRQLITAIAVGTVLALCVGLLIFVTRKHPAKAKKILAGFLKTEVLIALRLAFDLLDFVRLLISSFKSQRVFFPEHSMII